MKKDKRRFKITWPGNNNYPKTVDVEHFRNDHGINNDFLEKVIEFDVGEKATSPQGYTVKRIEDVTEALYDADKVRKIAGLPPAEKLTEARTKRVMDLVLEIGKKHGVDFKDADGDAAMKAMTDAYQQGVKDGKAGK